MSAVKTVRQPRRPGDHGEPAADAGRRAAHARAQLDELEVARQEHYVTFHEVARAWFAIHDRDAQRYAAPEREGFEREFKRLYKEFARTRHGVESAYFCEYIDVAAALTDIDAAANREAGARSDRRVPRGSKAMRVASRQSKRRPRRLRRTRTGVAAVREALSKQRRAASSAIHIELLLGHPEQREAKQLLFDCLDLHYRALEFLHPKHRKICMRRIFAIVASALGTLDARARDGFAARSGDRRAVTLTRSELECLKRELADTEAYFQTHAARRAQLVYFVGMTAGATALAVIWLVSLIWASVSDPLLLTMVSGGIGAVVSVMIRITRKQLVIDGQAGRLMTFLLGTFRPLTGAVFGLLLYMLIRGGVLTFTKTPPAGVDGSLFYAGLAFVAGFSERVAQVVVDTGARMIGSGSPDTTSERSGK